MRLERLAPLHSRTTRARIVMTPSTRYKPIPNQYIGAYHVGFTSQWITRKYLAGRGSVKLRPDQTVEARCPLPGYAPGMLINDGNYAAGFAANQPAADGGRGSL
ncbi:MAG: DUF4914 family protein [Clostridiales bacterium]|nr:DUF4914 family protein [Clostridiales bacterium]